ncbi:MAG: hypothetical protein LBL90_02395 [Prevotellaceae bacterium]|nr:hypothetical protein [Prevotellaceae bacterium]
MPQIRHSEIRLRERYFGAEWVAINPTKNPDAIINGSLLEFKSASCHNNVIIRAYGY